MIRTLKPLDRLEIPARDLFRAAPPVFHDGNKKVIHDLACPEGCRHGGTIDYSRWKAMEIPDGFRPFRAGPHAEVRAGFYDYERLLPHSAECM